MEDGPLDGKDLMVRNFGKEKIDKDLKQQILLMVSLYIQKTHCYILNILHKLTFQR